MSNATTNEKDIVLQRWWYLYLNLAQIGILHMGHVWFNIGMQQKMNCSSPTYNSINPWFQSLQLAV
jgi:hypothetical protein